MWEEAARTSSDTTVVRGGRGSTAMPLLLADALDCALLAHMGFVRQSFFSFKERSNTKEGKRPAVRGVLYLEKQTLYTVFQAIRAPEGCWDIRRL